MSLNIEVRGIPDEKSSSKAAQVLITAALIYCSHNFDSFVQFNLERAGGPELSTWLLSMEPGHLDELARRIAPPDVPGARP